MSFSNAFDAHPSLMAAHDEAYAHILGCLRSGRYRAGQRLIAETIAAELGSSRMPVREALNRLAAEGLVTLRANRGVTVNAPNVKEMREVFEMRAVLEGLAVRLALPRLGPADWRQIEALLEEMEPPGGQQPTGPAPTAPFTKRCAPRARRRACCARSRPCTRWWSRTCAAGRPWTSAT